MVEKNKRTIEKKIVSTKQGGIEDEKINNEINIKIDLGDYKKDKPKKRKSKPKPKTLDDMKTGATLNTASSLAPVKMGQGKFFSPDNNNNPNNNINLLLANAFANAFNRPLQPQLPPSASQQYQQLISGAPLNYANTIPTQYPTFSSQPPQQAIQAPPQQQQIQAPSISSTNFQTPLQSFLSTPSPSLYSTSASTLQPNPNIQQLQSGYTTAVQSPVIPTSSTPFSFPALNQDLLSQREYEALYEKQLLKTITPSEEQDLERLAFGFSPVIKNRIENRVQEDIKQRGSSSSSIIPPSPPMKSPQRPAPLVPQVKEEWNKPLLEIFKSGQGKKKYEQIQTDPNMINYADEVAMYLLQENPNLEDEIKRAINNPSSKLTMEPDGYRVYLKYLNKVIPDKSIFPYYHTVNQNQSKFKKMFYERFKSKIYNPEELSLVQTIEDQSTIPEEEVSPTSSSIPMASTLPSPTISSLVVPQPPPPPPKPLAPPPPPPPKPTTPSSKKSSKKPLELFDEFGDPIDTSGMGEKELLKLEIQSRKQQQETNQKYLTDIQPTIDSLTDELSKNKPLINKIKDTGKNRKETFIRLLKDKKFVPDQYLSSLENKIFAEALYSSFVFKNQSKL